MRYYDEKNRIYFEVDEKSSVLTDADKDITEVAIPKAFMDRPVTAIRKKAFLGCKTLRKVIIPETVKSVGEWAFAFCSSLAEIKMSDAPCVFSQGVFKNASSLRRIRIGTRSEDSSYLLAAAVTVMEAEYLLETKEAGFKEWLLRWDGRLQSILKLKDDDGYHLYVLCGEEDLHFDYDEYLEYNRRKKAGLCMLRLLWDEGLSGIFREEISSYIKEHCIIGESDAAFRYVLREHGDDIEYYELLCDLSCLGHDNLEKVLSELGDRHAEAKAFLLNRLGAGRTESDYFEGLML